MPISRRGFLQTIAAIAPALTGARSAFAADLSLQSLGANLTLISGDGANIAVLRGEDGLLLVDSGVADSATALESRLHSIAAVPVKVLINTHYHFDHVGANEIFGRAGARIIAHENVLKRLSAVQHNSFFNMDSAALAAQGRPNAPYSSSGTLAFGGEKVTYRHVPPAHTDGDTTVRFEKANVLHAGDLFFQGIYPFIDYSAGGSIEGMLTAAGMMVQAADRSTKIIPGHGPLATRDDLRAYGNMLSDINQRVSKLVHEGKSLAETQAAEPTKQWDAKWGGGFLKPADFVALLWSGKTGKPASPKKS